MYLEFFGISDKPFQITPDTRFLYLTPHHRDGLAHLLYGADEADGFVLLTGEVGTGKTMLCRSVLEQMPEHVNIALIINPRQSSCELIASICDELDISYRHSTSSLKYLVDRLNAYLLQQHAQGRRTVLVIDEAQNLCTEVLEQIRLLTNLEVATQKLLQIILIGQPELQTLLAKPELRQLTQRITARFHLTPLSREETAAYIRHRLQIVGFRGELFTNGAMHAVHQLSGGVPRLVNNICEHSMMGAYGENVHRIDKQVVRRAAGEVIQDPGRFQPLRWVSGVLAAGIVALLLAVWIFFLRTTPGSQVDTIDRMGAEEASQDVQETQVFQAMMDSPSPEEAVSAAVEEYLPDPPAQLDPVRQGDTEGPDHADDSSNSGVSGRTDDSETANNLGVPDPVRILGFAELINNPDLRADNNRAFTTLFSYWGHTYLELEGETACERAAAANLRCVFGKASWDGLRHYNRPAVIEILSTEGERKQAVVLALLEDQVGLEVGGEVLTASRAEIDPHWHGNYLLLWKPPPAGSDVLREGAIGEDVVWLRDQLDHIDGKTTNIGEEKKWSFDPTLKWRVMEFQRIRGLNVDGVVGRETMIKLNTAVNNHSTPLLWDQSS